MEERLINKNGCFTCEKVQEKYSQFCAGAFRGTIYYQYDYRHIDGELFSTVAKSLEECRKKKDKWLLNKEQAE